MSKQRRLSKEEEEERGLEDLTQDIRNFDENQKVPEGLGEHDKCMVGSKPMWFKKLSEAWKKSKPQTPMAATEVVYNMMWELEPAGPAVCDIEAVLDFYGLPSFIHIHLVKPRSNPDEVEDANDDEDDDDDDDEVTPLATAKSNPFVEAYHVVEPAEDIPEFALITLPVIAGEQVTDVGVLTVFVEVRELYVLSLEMLFLIDERRKALARKDDNRALELLNQINDTKDYKMKSIDDVDVLTRKYEIRLRGITPAGAEAKRKLANIVDGKCLSILVYYLDDEMRCVGDVFCDGDFLQPLLLSERTAWQKEQRKKDDDDDAELNKLGEIVNLALGWYKPQSYDDID